MIHKSTRDILSRNFSGRAGMGWFAVGLAIGIAGLLWGSSPLTGWALTLATGYGGLLLCLVCIAVVLASTARWLDSRMGRLAHGDFQNIQPWLLGKLLRAAAVFFGLVVVAAVSWCATGNVNALMTAVMGTVLGVCAAYCWCGLALIADAVRL